MNNKGQGLPELRFRARVANVTEEDESQICPRDSYSMVVDFRRMKNMDLFVHRAHPTIVQAVAYTSIRTCLMPHTRNKPQGSHEVQTLASLGRMRIYEGHLHAQDTVILISSHQSSIHRFLFKGKTEHSELRRGRMKQTSKTLHDSMWLPNGHGDHNSLCKLDGLWVRNAVRILTRRERIAVIVIHILQQCSQMASTKTGSSSTPTALSNRVVIMTWMFS